MCGRHQHKVIQVRTVPSLGKKARRAIGGPSVVRWPVDREPCLRLWATHDAVTRISTPGGLTLQGYAVTVLVNVLPDGRLILSYADDYSVDAIDRSQANQSNPEIFEPIRIAPDLRGQALQSTG